MKPYFSSRFCLALAALTVFTVSASGWGHTGHDVTCAIAENHLSPKAKKQIAFILDGRSIVYWAKWLDNASHNIPEYRYTSCWHYKNIDAGENFDDVKNPDGDVVTKLAEHVDALKSGKLSKEEAAFALKVVIHLCADMHCPMHMAHKCDKGGNMIQIRFFGQGTNLHKVFDNGVIDKGRGWSYSEWAKQLDIVSDDRIEAITAGSFDDWGKGTLAITTSIYEKTDPKEELSFAYCDEWLGPVEQQLLYGGLRLASILNGIFN